MLTCPGRRFRLRLKTSVTAVLLISVFISSSFLVQNAHAQTTPPATGTVTLSPNVGSSNPFANTLANSESFMVATGYDDLSGNTVWPSTIYGADDGSSLSGSGQAVREAAIYANGNEPMAVAIAYASETSVGVAVAQTVATLADWPYLIFSKTTGKPLGSKTYYSNIPLDLSYSCSMTATGGYPLAEGTFDVQIMGVGVGGTSGNYSVGIGPAADESGGSPKGTLSCTYSGYGGQLTVSLSASALVESAYGFVTESNYPLGEAQAVIDPYLSIDPSSPLASQLQVYEGNTANANPKDPSEWTPSVQTAIDLNNIVPLATPFANSTASPSITPTPTPTKISEMTPLLTVAALFVATFLIAIAIRKKTQSLKTTSFNTY